MILTVKWSMCNDGKSQSQAPSVYPEATTKRPSTAALFPPKIKNTCTGELFHAVTFDPTRQATLAIKTLIPQLKSNGDAHDWLMIKDIGVTLFLIFELAVDFDTLLCSELKGFTLKFFLTENDF